MITHNHSGASQFADKTTSKCPKITLKQTMPPAYPPLIHRLSTAHPPLIHRTSTAIAAFGAVEMRRISGGLAKREKPKAAKTRKIRRKRLMDVSGKGIRVEGRGPTPALARGRQALGRGRRRFVATNCLRPAEGGASPRRRRFEFVATNPESLSRHIRTCRNPPIPETRGTRAERNVRCSAKSWWLARSRFPQTTEEPFRFVRYCQNLHPYPDFPG